MSKGSQLPKRSDFPPGVEFVIKEFDVPWYGSVRNVRSSSKTGKMVGLNRTDFGSIKRSHSMGFSEF